MLFVFEFYFLFLCRLVEDVGSLVVFFGVSCVFILGDGKASE